MPHRHFASTFITSCVSLGICLGALAVFSPEPHQDDSLKKQSSSHSTSHQSLAVTEKSTPTRTPAIAEKPLKFEKYYKLSSAQLGCEQFLINGLYYHAQYLEADGQKYSIDGVGSSFGIMPPIDDLSTKEEVNVLEEMDFRLVLNEEADNICFSKYPNTAQRSDWGKIRELTGFNERN